MLAAKSVVKEGPRSQAVHREDSAHPLKQHSTVVREIVYEKCQSTGHTVTERVGHRCAFRGGLER